jgi:hypothetical protein
MLLAAARPAMRCSTSLTLRTMASRSTRRREASRKPSRPASPPPPAEPVEQGQAAPEPTPITQADKHWALASVVFGALAIGGFTLNKWEIEKRLKELPPDVEAQWRAGEYKPKPGS